MNRLLRLATVLLFSGMLMAVQSFAASVPLDRISLYLSRENPRLDDILVSLYGNVEKGGYIWIVTSSLTQPVIAHALIEAKKRGVDVRIISDREKLGAKRDEIAMYNLNSKGIPVKVNRFSGVVRLEASIVDDSYVVVGSYNYGSTETRSPLGMRVDEENLLVIPARVDKAILQQYKDAFQRMWNDAKSYEGLQ